MVAVSKLSSTHLVAPPPCAHSSPRTSHPYLVHTNPDQTQTLCPVLFFSPLPRTRSGLGQPRLLCSDKAKWHAGPPGVAGRSMGWWFLQYRLKTFFYDNSTPFAPRICHGKFAVTDARRGAEREPPRALERALLRTVRRHPWFGTVHGGPCPRDTRPVPARRTLQSQSALPSVRLLCRRLCKSTA